MAVRVLDWDLRNNEENEMIGSTPYEQPVSGVCISD